MSLYLTDEKSTLIQVMAWCRQAISHYHLRQCWPRPMLPYGVSRLQCVNKLQWILSLFCQAPPLMTSLVNIYTVNFLPNTHQTPLAHPLLWDKGHLNGFVQERRNSIANVLELRLSCTNPLIYFSFVLSYFIWSSSKVPALSMLCYIHYFVTFHHVIKTLHHHDHTGHGRVVTIVDKRKQLSNTM